MLLKLDKLNEEQHSQLKNLLDQFKEVYRFEKRNRKGESADAIMKGLVNELTMKMCILRPNAQCVELEKGFLMSYNYDAFSVDLEKLQKFMEDRILSISSKEIDFTFFKKAKEATQDSNVLSEKEIDDILNQSLAELKM